MRKYESTELFQYRYKIKLLKRGLRKLDHSNRSLDKQNQIYRKIESQRLNYELELTKENVSGFLDAASLLFLYGDRIVMGESGPLPLTGNMTVEYSKGAPVKTKTKVSGGGIDIGESLLKSLLLSPLHMKVISFKPTKTETKVVREQMINISVSNGESKGKTKFPISRYDDVERLISTMDEAAATLNSRTAEYEVRSKEIEEKLATLNNGVDLTHDEILEVIKEYEAQLLQYKDTYKDLASLDGRHTKSTMYLLDFLAWPIRITSWIPIFIAIIFTLVIATMPSLSILFVLLAIYLLAFLLWYILSYVSFNHLSIRACDHPILNKFERKK